MARGPSIAILVAVVSVSFASIFIRWSESPALTIALYRMGFATLMIAPFLAVGGRTTLRGLGRRDVGLLGIVGFALAVHFATWILSLKLVDVATSVVLVTSHPILVAIVSHFAFGERVTPLMAGGIGVGLGGVVLIAFAQSGQGPDPILGSALAFLGGVAAGAYILAGRRLRQQIDIVPYAVGVYGFTTVFLFAFSALTPMPYAIVGDLGTEIILFLLLALISQIGGHTLYNWSLKHVPATLVSTSLLAEPVGASILAFLLLGEVPGCFGGTSCEATGLVILGSVLALVGIYLVSRQALRPGSPGRLASSG